MLFAAVAATCLFSPGRAAEREGEATPLRKGRVAAVMAALFYYDAGIVEGGDKFGATRDETAFTSTSPARATAIRERGKVVEFAQSLIYEGGYYPREIYALLGYREQTTARAARLVRQLDTVSGGRPSPWEVAGRVGRSSLGGASDQWAMAPGESGEPGISSPGTLAYLPVLAVAYAEYPVDGREASAQLAILKDDDLRAASVARAGVSLLMSALSAGERDRDEWLRQAAADSGDADTEYDLRAVRVKDWRYLRGEECAMGRLERAAFLWYRNRDFASTMAAGSEMLRSRESMAYLAALAAATYDQEGLSTEIIRRGASDPKLLELTNDLYALATSEAVLRVAPAEE